VHNQGGTCPWQESFQCKRSPNIRFQAYDKSISSFSCSAFAEEIALQKIADEAMETGDIDLAFESYMGLVELLPDNGEVLSITATLASELGLTEMAIELWLKRADLAINQSEKVAAAEAHAEITTLYNLMPPSFVAKFDEVSQIANEEQAEAFMMLEALAQEAEEAVVNQDVETAVNARESVLMVATDLFGESHWARSWIFVSAIRIT